MGDTFILRIMYIANRCSQLEKDSRAGHWLNDHLISGGGGGERDDHTQ